MMRATLQAGPFVILQDLRAVTRGLVRSPGFTLAVVLTLGLGLGASAAIYTVVDGVLLRPLPYRHPGRLFALGETSAQVPGRLPSYPAFLEYRSARSFEGMGYIVGQADALRRPDGIAQFGAARVSEGFFGVLGAEPLLGRLPGPADEQSGADPVAVLSYPFWRSSFGGDPGVVGRPLTTVDRSYTIIGVLPPGAGYPFWADVFTPLAAVPPPVALSRRDLHVDGAMLARLRPGATRAEADRELTVWSARLGQENPADQAGFRATLTPLAATVVGPTVRAPLLILLAATGVLLLIACVNVMNLGLARLGARTRDLALRTALGAGRFRLARQLLAEALVLALAGLGLGLGVALLALRLVRGTGRSILLQAGLTNVVPRVDQVVLDGRVFAAAFGVTLLVGLATGLLPALTSSRADLAAVLKGGGRGAAPAARRWRRVLIGLQAGLAAALLVSAALLTVSFWRLSRVDPGFRPDGLVEVHVEPSPRFRSPDSDIASLYRRLLDAAGRLPGAVSVGLVNHLPMGGSWNGTRVGIDGVPPAEGTDLTVGLRAVSAGYRETMGIPLLSGRWFRESDMRPDAGDAVVINRTMANRFWPGQDPIGHRVSFYKSASGRADFGQPLLGTVVGVVGDVRQFGLDQPSDAAIYLPYPVNPWGHSYLVVRGRGQAAVLVEPLRRALIAEEPDLVITEDRPMRDVVEGSLGSREFLLLLVSGFALAALVLAAIGLYGVLSHLVRSRERELGIRQAIGADRPAIVRLVLWEGLSVASGGALAGLAAAWAMGGLLASQLYGITPADPTAYLAGLVLVVSVSLAACYLPACRAARVDPLIALRSE